MANMTKDGIREVMLRRALVGVGDRDEVVKLPAAEAEALVKYEHADYVVEGEEPTPESPLAERAADDAADAAPPTVKSSRAEIDAWAAKYRATDTTGASSKTDALAMLGIE